MIKTLRITSIVVAILAVVLLVLPVVFGVRSDPKIEEFLKSPDAIAKFGAARGQRPATNESQTSPLVKQAVDFARYLNPPPPPPSREVPAAARSPQAPAPPVPVTPKFNLIGTSYYADRPELSLALIDEPGKGLNWVRQGNTVGHLTIEQIKNGSITIRDGRGTSEMTVKVNQLWRSLLKNPPPETSPAPVPEQHSSSVAAAQPRSLPPSVPISPGSMRPRVGESPRVRPGATGAQLPPGSPDVGLPSHAPAATPAPPPAVENEPPVELSPQEKERAAQIKQLLEEMEFDSPKITEEEMAKLNKLVELLEQPESTNSPDVNN